MQAALFGKYVTNTNYYPWSAAETTGGAGVRSNVEDLYTCRWTAAVSITKKVSLERCISSGGATTTMSGHMISEQLMIGWFVSNQMEVVLGHAQKSIIDVDLISIRVDA